MRISVFNSAELQGVIVAMKGFDREVAKQIRQATKAMIDPEWRKAVSEHAQTLLESRALAQTARVAISDQNVTLKSAAVGKKLSGGLLPSANYAGVEFGADRQVKTTYTATSSKGNQYSVTRRTRAQLRPRRKGGYVVFPAAAGIIPRMASLWTQTVVRTFYEIVERR